MCQCTVIRPLNSRFVVTAAAAGRHSTKFMPDSSMSLITTALRGAPKFFALSV